MISLEAVSTPFLRLPYLAASCTEDYYRSKSYMADVDGGERTRFSSAELSTVEN